MKSRQSRRIARPKKLVVPPPSSEPHSQHDASQGYDFGIEDDEETYNGWEDLSAAYQGYY